MTFQHARNKYETVITSRSTASRVYSTVKTESSISFNSSIKLVNIDQIDKGLAIINLSFYGVILPEEVISPEQTPLVNVPPSGTHRPAESTYADHSVLLRYTKCWNGQGLNPKIQT